MKYVKLIGKFVKASFMSATDEQAAFISFFSVMILIALAVA